MTTPQKSSYAPIRHLRQYGVTLVELMITIAVAAILLGIAIPSFTEMRHSVRANTGIDQLQQDLIYGRQLSVAYQNTITVCPLDNADKCADEWINGYKIFIDTGTKGQFDAGDEVLITRAAFHEDDFISAAEEYTFTTEGFLNQNQSIIYCPADKSNDYNKQLDLTVTGVVSRSGNPSNCP